MEVAGRHHRSIVRRTDDSVEIVDQRRLPHVFETARLHTLEDAATAIRDMWVRGAPLIGATAAYGLWLALRQDGSDRSLADASSTLLSTRPTAVNLRWAIERVREVVADRPSGERAEAARAVADRIAEEDVRMCEAIGEHGRRLLEERAAETPAEPTGPRPHALQRGVARDRRLGHGSRADLQGARPRSPGARMGERDPPAAARVARLTAWELGEHGIPHTVIVDGAGAHLMQRGHVDLVMTGTDRTTSTGGVFNKIGTYPKALAARDNDVPFYVAVPGSSIDWSLADDATPVLIEEREGDEVRFVRGVNGEGAERAVLVTRAESEVANPAFDFTPARLVTGLVTERGICAPGDLTTLYPEAAR